MAKLARLIRYHDDSRKERFFPFLLVFEKDASHPRYTEALAIARYFLDNAFPVTREDREFYDTLEQTVHGENLPDYFVFAGRTPYSLAEYLKVTYDLRPMATPLSIKGDVIHQLEAIMKARHMTKTELARKMNTSRASLDRLLDPGHSVTLTTLQNAADALGYDLTIRFVPPDTDMIETQCC